MEPAGAAVATSGATTPRFTTRDGATGYYRDAAPVPERLFCASTLPDVLFWKVLSFWRTARDGPPL